MVLYSAFIHINVQMRFTNYYRADSWETYIDRPLQRLTNILYINNALSRRDKPHNIEITTLLFTIDVWTPVHLEEMFIRAQKYSTCWIFGADGTSDQIRSKQHRTLEELAYANSHDWLLAQLIALVCAELNCLLML